MTHSDAYDKYIQALANYLKESLHRGVYEHLLYPVPFSGEMFSFYLRPHGLDEVNSETPPPLLMITIDCEGELAIKAAKAEEVALERIHEALTEATHNDRLSLAVLAILKVGGCYFPPKKAAEKDSLFSPLSDKSLVSLAIEILQGLQDSDEDAMVDAAITEYITLRGLQQLR